MAKLTGRLGVWELPHVHMWKDRSVRIRAEGKPILSPATKIATIGSCFAEEIAAALGRFGLSGGMHPAGRFLTTRAIRQEIERAFGGWPTYREEPPWAVPGGFVHPFKDYTRVFSSTEALAAWSDELDHRSELLFREASVVVVTLGLIEAWTNPRTGNTYRNVPHPEILDGLGARFHRLSVAEMIEDLKHIRRTLSENTGATLVLTVSPIPLHATLTPLDVRVANMESKSRIRAAVSEFVEAHPDVLYFHSYEMVATAERASDFMREDGRHVERRGVDYIVAEFLRQFAAPGVVVPDPDAAWLTPPSQTAPTVRQPFRARVRRALGRPLRRLLARRTR